MLHSWGLAPVTSLPIAMEWGYRGSMSNPQAAENLLAVIRGLPAADRVWLLSQLEHDVELSTADLAQFAMYGGAFSDLADEPDLYSLSDGEPVLAG